MPTQKIMAKCFFCGRQFQMGPHAYDGRYISCYQVNACSICYESNWDGWSSRYDAKIVEHLNTLDRPIPNRNSKGLFPRETQS